MAGIVAPLALQWALNETVTGAFTVSRDILVAATSDNVQVAALAAVEAFGATLAICDETETRVEGLNRVRSSRVVKFLKSWIGYAAGDSCDALLVSTGGIRFLALAATFMTWGHFQAAQATRQMLRETSKENQILPTLGQLQALYKVLEHKIVGLGFADEVMKWHLQVVDNVRTHGLANDPTLFDLLGTPLGNRLQQTSGHPPPDTMAALVRAFRDLYRIGDASRVEIRAGTASIWIIAFTVWCVGRAPRVILKNGTIICDDPLEEPKIELWAFMDDEQVEIRTSTHLYEPQQLWKASIPNDFYAWAGMVSIEQYGKREIQDCELESGQGNRALTQAIVHSTTEVLSRIPLLKNDSKYLDQTFPEDENLESRIQIQLQFCQAPAMKTFQARVTSTISKFIGMDDTEKYRLRDLKEGQQIRDLTNVQGYTESLQTKCRCPYCSSDPSSQEDCAIDWFEYFIAAITAKIIAISLFDLTEPVRLFFSGSRLPWDTPSPARLIAKVGKLLFPDSRFHKSLFGGMLNNINKNTMEQCISLSELFDLALAMIGHDIQSRHLYDGRWIASAQRGQVVYPHLFDSRYLNPRSILLLDGGPGILHHAGERYALVMSRDQTVVRPGPPQAEVHDRPVKSLLNLLPAGTLGWLVSHTRCSRGILDGH